MIKVTNYSMTDIKGSLEVFLFHHGAIEETIATFNNTVVYGGSDILARCLAGDVSYSIAGMYMEFSNVPIAAGPSFTRARDVTYYQGLTGNLGYCRIPTLTQPSYTAQSASFTGNEVTFVALTDGTYGATGAVLTDGTSEFYGAGLVASTDWSDDSTDILFSSVNFDSGGGLTPITKVANAQFGVKWKIRFT